MDKYGKVDRVVDQVLGLRYQNIKDPNKDFEPELGGGRLTSLDALFARCFAFLRTSPKTSTSMFFKNIAKTLHR